MAGVLSGRSIHNRELRDDGVMATLAEAQQSCFYNDVAVTMSKLLPGMTDPSH